MAARDLCLTGWWLHQIHPLLKLYIELGELKSKHLLVHLCSKNSKSL